MQPLTLSRLVAVPVFVLPALAGGTSFTPLPLGPQGYGYFSPTGVSADGLAIAGGSYIVGQGNQARRWRSGIGFDYPGPSVGATATWCSGISADGSVVSGGSGHAQFGDLEGWMRYGASAGHVGTPPGHDTSDCTAVSADGVVTVGYGGFQSNPNLFQAAYYTEQNDWTNLGFLPGGSNSAATCCSASGAVIAGWSATGAGIGSGFRWTASGGMVSIGNLPGGNDCEPRAMSDDGSVIVGNDYVGTPSRGFRWTASGGMVDIGSFAPGAYVWAEDVSDDGALIVGIGDDGGGNAALIWDAAHGVRRLADLLAAQGLGAELAGWELASVDCVRGTGPWFLAGVGAHNNYWEAYLVRLESLEPAAGSALCFGDGTQAVPCPCGNNGASGHGCANSADASGAQLFAWGTPSADDVVLDVAGTLPNALCIFLQGNALQAAPVPFGDGLLCAGGQLKRLASRNAVHGAARFPEAGDPSIRARSAALGDSIANGSQRHYQVYYRDPAAGFCPAPQGSTWNASSAQSIQW